MRIRWDFQSVFKWLTRFPITKMFKAQWGRDRNVDESWRILLLIAKHHFFTMRISGNNNITHFVGWLFHTLDTLANQ